jgi:hypothetical protein
LAVFSAIAVVTVHAVTGNFPEIQLGLSGISRHGQARFANALYMAPNWQTNASGGWTWRDVLQPQVDTKGYPQYVLSGIPLVALPLYDASPFEQATMCKGRFSLMWEGEADIRLPYATLVSGSVSGVELDGRREYRSVDGAGTRMITYIYAINTNNPPRKIRLWLPDPSDPDNKSLAPEPGQPEPIFHPTYLDVVRPFRLVRFMDWLLTNNNPSRNWDDRRAGTHCSMCGPHLAGRGTTSGVAYEQCVALCNELGLDMWICVPHFATAEYVTNLARLILYGSDGWMPYTASVTNPVFAPLNTNLRCYVEYSNEMWNPGFSQGSWAYHTSVTAGVTWAAYVARQNCNVWKIFDGVWGENTNRIVHVGAGRSSDATYCRQFFDEAISNGYKPDFVSIAPYFGNDIQLWVYAQGAAFFKVTNDVNINRTLDELNRRILASQTGTSSMNDDTGGGIAQSIRGMALDYNVPIVNYEGGPSIYTDAFDTPSNQPTGAWLTAFMHALNRHPRFAETYRINLNLCKMRGMQTHAVYLDLSRWTKYGQWGHKEETAQPIQTNQAGYAVKYRFILDWQDEQQAIRHIDAPLNNVPKFDTAYVLPSAKIGRSYSTDIAVSSGDGARRVDVIGTYLPQGLSVRPANGDPDRLRLSGVPARPVDGGLGYVFARVLDADGDPAWGKFIFSTVGGNGTIVESDFNGDAPAKHLPWTNTFILAPGFTYSGWNSGAGILATYTNANALVYCLNLPLDEASATLARAIANNEYWRFTLSPPAGTTVDLRNAEVQFTVGRIGYHAPRRYALLTSIDGFSDSTAVYSTPRFTSMLPETFSAIFPTTEAYRNITAPVEFRIYGFAGQYAWHPTSLSAFKLTASNVTFNQQPVAIADTATMHFVQAAFIDVLANDTDWDGDILTLASVSTATYGIATISNNAVYYIAPALNCTDIFSYIIHDGRGSTDEALVTVRVIPESIPAMCGVLLLFGQLRGDRWR